MEVVKSLNKQVKVGQFILQAVGDLRRRTLLPGKNLQKIKELQAANKKKEVSESKSFFASIKQYVIKLYSIQNYCQESITHLLCFKYW